MSQCTACDEALVLVPDDDDGAAAPPVPDDLQLGCGCHFHWECLMDEAPAVALSLKCPGCDAFLPANEPGPSSTNSFRPSATAAPILARYTNEGGVDAHLDILPAITEEAYLHSNPDARPARALHVMCAEGDVDAIVELLRGVEGQVSDVVALVRYQDPLADMTSGLHLAVDGGHEQVVWLLLWLSSTMAAESFPGPARAAAESMRLGRFSVGPGDDVRGLRDGRGRTAEDVARERPGPWAALLQAGALSA